MCLKQEPNPRPSHYECGRYSDNPVRTSRFPCDNSLKGHKTLLDFTGFCWHNVFSLHRHCTVKNSQDDLSHNSFNLCYVQRCSRILMSRINISVSSFSCSNSILWQTSRIWRACSCSSSVSSSSKTGNVKSKP